MNTRSRRVTAGWFAGLLATSMLGGCLGTRRLQDEQAPRDFYKQWSEKETPCDHPIRLLPPGALPGRPHREVASLSATCSPGSIELCERRLRERACALGADALLLMEGESGPNPASVPVQTQISRSARALRWE